jgi:signal transduction histidine kinase
LQIERRRHRRFIEEEKEQNNKENSERSFHVKSLEIEWEGKSSFMHVFIETTNIVKLEEAKTNIKCQKIMFASASHEFRTPLNAIMNSFNFIGDNFK